MVAYKKDEIVSASDMARTFATVLNSIVKCSKDKIAISKNNKLEAVIINIDEYERLKEAEELLEHQEIYNLVKQRSTASQISHKDMLKKLGISQNDLMD